MSFSLVPTLTRRQNNVSWQWDAVVDRPTELICISDIYLLSWRWWPLWGGGLLYQWSLRPKKTSWFQFFRKISVSCTYCPWRSKKQDKKRAKTLQKKVFFQPPWPNFAFIPQTVRTICGIPKTVRTICGIPQTVCDMLLCKTFFRVSIESYMYQDCL